MPVRHAAKAVLYCGDEFLLVAGESGRLNLPGGGTDGQEPHIALRRELEEELGLSHDQIHGLELAGTTEGIVTSKRGEALLAHWTIYVARMDLPIQELIPGEDITQVLRAPRETILQYTAPYISDLARQSILIAT